MHTLSQWWILSCAVAATIDPYISSSFLLALPSWYLMYHVARKFDMEFNGTVY